MKTIIFFIAFALAHGSYCQTYMAPNKDYIQDISLVKPIDKETLNKAFKEILDFGIPFKYPQGGCESRAYAMNLILNKMGVNNTRIWVYAPSKFVAGNYESLTITDINDPNDIVSWSYHTAPVVLVKNGTAVDTVVLDPAINSEKPLNINDWLKSMKGSEKSRYSIVPGKFYLFYTMNNLINGNYYEYVDYSYNSMLIERNLAFDMVGRYLHKMYLSPGGSKYNAERTAFIKPLISNIYNLENYILYNKFPSGISFTERELTEKYPNFIIDCKNVFNREFLKWRKQLKELSVYQK